ncbi:MAG: MBL fold metallo-hydrolase [Thermoflexales bacterium]|nr:MBL fold metallo-hydrolase [Thermoflexales bacterium]
MQEITHGVYVESGYHGVTVGAIVTKEDVICVDSPTLPADARAWRARLAKLTPKPVRYIVYTDVQRDRVLGAQYLEGATVAHESGWETMKGYGEVFRQQTADLLSHSAPEASLEITAGWRLVLPQLTLGRQLTFYRGSTPIVVQHVGGPTPSSLWVLLPERNVLFAGDTVTCGAHPSLAEADLETWITLLKKLNRKKTQPLTIVPGRGGAVASLDDVDRLYHYLLDVRRRVRRLVRSGQPRSQAASLVQDLMPAFPARDDERELVQRRVKAGLERAYEIYRSEP